MKKSIGAICLFLLCSLLMWGCNAPHNTGGVPPRMFTSSEERPSFHRRDSDRSDFDSDISEDAGDADSEVSGSACGSSGCRSMGNSAPSSDHTIVTVPSNKPSDPKAAEVNAAGLAVLKAAWESKNGQQSVPSLEEIKKIVMTLPGIEAGKNASLNFRQELTCGEVTNSDPLELAMRPTYLNYAEDGLIGRIHEVLSKMKTGDRVPFDRLNFANGLGELVYFRALSLVMRTNGYGPSEDEVNRIEAQYRSYELARAKSEVYEACANPTRYQPATRQLRCELYPKIDSLTSCPRAESYAALSYDAKEKSPPSENPIHPNTQLSSSHRAIAASGRASLEVLPLLNLSPVAQCSDSPPTDPLVVTATATLNGMNAASAKMPSTCKSCRRGSGAR